VPPRKEIEADKETVLAWMDRWGKGYSIAAQHFKLPMERVKKWAQRAPKPVPRVSPTVPKDPAAVPRQAKRAAPELEAYTPHARDALRASFGGAQTYGRILARSASEYEAAQDERARQRKLGVPENALPDLPELLDPAWLVAAHRAQKLALEIAPGLATFDAALADPSTAGPVVVDPVALAAEVAKRMRAPPVSVPSPSNLRVIK
jgi:hypothetical protein